MNEDRDRKREGRGRLVDLSHKSEERGDYRSALRYCREIAKLDPHSLPCAAQLELLLGDADAAKDSYDRARAGYPWRRDDHFIGSGVARWLLSEYVDAISVWKSGLNCSHVIGGTGLYVPMLLYFAAVREPKLISLEEADDYVGRRLNQARAVWSQVNIATFLMGDMSEGELRKIVEEECREERDRSPEWVREGIISPDKALAQVDFYVAVAKLRDGDKAGYRKYMTRCASYQDKHRWPFEWFIARDEVEKFKQRNWWKPTEPPPQVKTSGKGKSKSVKAPTLPATAKFYSNLTVRGPTQDELVDALDELDREAYISTTIGRDTVAFDKQCESQHEPTLQKLAVAFSRRLKCPVLAVLVHDDDTLWYRLCDRGKIVDKYDSCHGYFGGNKPTTPVGGDSTKLCATFGKPRSEKRVQAILHTKEYAFATEQHRDLVKALGLNDWAVGHGYNSLDFLMKRPEGFVTTQL